MKQILIASLFVAAFACLTVAVYAACLPSRTYRTLLDTGCQPTTLKIVKRERNYISWPDGTMSNSIDTVGYGGCNSQHISCYPEFFTPVTSEGHWEQVVADRRVTDYRKLRIHSASKYSNL